MRRGMKFIIGCDICAHDLKDKLVKALKEKGYDITDAGTSGADDGDFSDAAEVVCRGIQGGEYQRGILVCGTGIGMCIAANKFKGIRAGLAYDIVPAGLASQDNNTNVLCTGVWFMDNFETCLNMIETWALVRYTERDSEGMKRAELIECTM